jgi:hypothetical protein
MIFDVLDGGNGATVPNVLESWDLEGCFLTSVDYGDMAYNSSDPVQIACNIRFDNAVQTVGGAVGSPNLITTRTPAGAITG